MALFASADLKTKATIDALGTVTYSGLPTHDGAANAATLTDSTRSFPTSGAKSIIGGTIYNVTDGSSGAITAATATTVIATLSGGTDNDWDVGDTYLITHPENGIFGSLSTQIQVRDLVNVPSGLTAFYVSAEIEQECFSADSSDYPTQVIQSTSSQASRALAAGRVMYLENSAFNKFRSFEIRPNSATTFAYVTNNGSGAASVSTLIGSNATSRDFWSSTGVQFGKVVIDGDQAGNQIYINRLPQSLTEAAPAGDFDEDLFFTFRLGQTANRSWGDFWIRNLEFHDARYVNHLDGPTSRVGTVRLAGIGGSFVLKAFPPENPGDNKSGFGFRVQQPLLAAGFDTTLLNHGENGRGWGVTNRVDSSDIAALAADNPTDVLACPSVNDLGVSTAFGAGLTSIEDYETRLLESIQAIADISTVKRVHVTTQQNFMNTASSAGFGGTDAKSEFHYNNRETVSAINAIWIGLKNNQGLTASARRKIQNTIQWDTGTGAWDQPGREYSREFTIGSSTESASKGVVRDDLHPSVLGNISAGEVIAPSIVSAIINSGSGGVSVGTFVAGAAFINRS